VNRQVSIRPAAKADLQESRDWYEQQRAGLGDEFLISIAAVMKRLEESPKRSPVYYHGFRRILADRFPYKIFFRIEGPAVIVFRILHSARDHRRHVH
jgi:plasmid stabilization system protein ParE